MRIIKSKAEMEELRRQLAALDADQVKQLLSTSGHDALLSTLQTQADDANDVAVDVAALKAQGNALFQQRQFEDAVKIYSQCIDASSSGNADATLFSNRAMAFLKLQQYNRVIDDCTSALGILPSIKPYLRRATAYMALGKVPLAVQDLDAALSHEPRNHEALCLLEKIAVSREHDRTTRMRAILLVSFRDGWTSMAVKGNPAPPGLNGHVLFTVPDDPQQRVLLYGGRAVRDQKPSVYMMEEQDHSWDLASTEGASPMPRAWHSVCPLGFTTLAVYGGVSASGEDPRVHILEAVPSPSGYSMSWREDLTVTHASPAPLARSGHASISVVRADGKQTAVVFGGRTKHGVTKELWTMMLKDSTVAMDQINRSEEPWPAPRDGHTMVAWVDSNTTKQHAVVFGGNGQQTEQKRNDLWMLDIVTHQWTELVCTGDIPLPRSYHSAHMVDGFMVVIGGRMVDAENGDVFILDLETREWFRVPIPTAKALTPRAWHASILRDLHSDIYLLGGGTFHGPSRDAAVLNLSKFKEMLKHLTLPTSQ